MLTLSTINKGMKVLVGNGERSAEASAGLEGVD
jgi:hypothetical protein